jgi:hypothetical protein
MLYDRVYFATATIGTGTITAGSAEAGFRTMAGASIPDGTEVEYTIHEGNNWEDGVGVVGSSGTTLTRVLSQSSSGSLLSLSGRAKVLLTAIAARMRQYKKLAADETNSTVTLANVTGLSFTAVANKTYVVEVMGAFQAAASTTGLALALDIPSGSIIGQMIHATSATGVGGTEQIADAATTGATTGVRNANTNTPFTSWFVIAIGGTGGTVQVQFRSEVATSAVVLKANLTIMSFREV